MVRHWLPLIVLAWVWTGLFGVTMPMKGAGMSRHPERAASKAQSRWLLPFVISGSEAPRQTGGFTAIVPSSSVR